VKSLLVVYGRVGDIVSSMLAAACADEKYGTPDILVHERYSAVADLLKEDGAPVSDVVKTGVSCRLLDDCVSGLNMSRLSGEILKFMYPGYDRYLNCAPRGIPKGTSIAVYMAYCAGVSERYDVQPRSFPILHRALTRRRPGPMACFHFGSSDEARKIVPGDRMCEGYTSVCMGGKNDPCPEWIDVDMRGASLRESVETMLVSGVVCGTDSAFTHLSGIYGIPTVCVHNSASAMMVYNRSIYGRNCKSVIGMDNFRNVANASMRNIP